jgi:serine/threonine protein kinase
MNKCPNCNKPYEAGDEVCRTCGFILPISSPVIAPGEILQTRYEIQELVHSGGMGYVYLATDKRLYDRFCIVKQIKEPIKSEAHRKKLEEEALRMAKLDHPNVAMILDHFIDNGYYFLVVERIHGKTLSQVLKEKRGHLTENEVLGWSLAICDVVSYLHKEGIVHRDISPDNIMLTNEGSIKFIDFGTLREFRNIAPGGTAGMGKYGYTPPEQWRGKPEFRSDIFALGATIYYLLTGFLPLSKGYSTRQAPQKEDFNPSFPPIRTKNPNVSPQLEAVLQKALKLDVNDRHSTVEEFGQALKGLERVNVKKVPPSKFETKSKAMGVRPKPVRMSRPKTGMLLRWVFISLGIILLLIAGASGIYFANNHLSTASTPSPAIAIQGISTSNITDTGAVITWSTDKPATSQVKYGLTADLGSTTPVGQEPVTSHSVKLTGLQPNTTYYFRAISEAADGKEAISDAGQLTTLPAVVQPTPPPTLIPPRPAELSFKAKTYTNAEYGFSVQYPQDWSERTDLVTTAVVAVFGIPQFVPGISLSVNDADKPLTASWLVSATNSLDATTDAKVIDLTPTTLDDGTPAFQYKLSYNYVNAGQYAIVSYGTSVDQNGKRIRAFCWTIDEVSPYDEKLFSEITHTLTLASTQPSPTPPVAATPSFKAKTYNNDQYGFSFQYPSEWVEAPNLMTTTYHLAGFSVVSFVPGVVALAFDADAPETDDWVIKTFRLMNATDPIRISSPITNETLPGGQRAYTYKINYVSTQFEVTAYVLDADKDGKRIRIEVFTIEQYEPYNEKLFSEIAHTLVLTTK